MAYKMHDNLRAGSPGRLGEMRRYAERWNNDKNKVARGVPRIDWREARKHGVGSIRAPFAVHRAERIMVLELRALSGLREASREDCPEWLQSQGTGYYADSFADEVYTPVVYRLPRGAGWLFGYSRSNGGDAVMSASVEVSPRGAWRDAYHMAERDAEEAREHDEKWQEANDAANDREDARRELREARRKAAGAVAALRAQREAGAVVPALCDVLRDVVTQCRQDMRDALGVVQARTQTIAGLGMAGEF